MSLTFFVSEGFARRFLRESRKFAKVSVHDDCNPSEQEVRLIPGKKYTNN